MSGRRFPGGGGSIAPGAGMGLRSLIPRIKEVNIPRVFLVVELFFVRLCDGVLLHIQGNAAMGSIPSGEKKQYLHT